jgi:hypothetical protein
MFFETGIFFTKDLFAHDFSNSGWKNRIKILLIGMASIFFKKSYATLKFD